ncbi:5-methyltetrahydropteroyltriglutamate--homocysteine S-methyltransferase [Saccharibacillus alkalitolerans]|uniref:5-methyltetrahydropteroyltriglutamate--homocysteine S-methyltransferase n=1 Tax=Saccharibacillus alkalitolerans TaxID=2705290 RepID=A0ABX0F5T2_9BACL|nr:5-methyltetrahydropteroyltriglutamate--homocysteine S-methyltransferase [Saccharibacillus alkalitolerans]NGZ76311.1 5-methyltetrahydropteroyltriglutamate--homocysteine S-methyltransferase [Saccharibacillus alkalitolerans]
MTQASNTGLRRTTAPFRADQVGSLLRPESIKQARLQLAAGQIDAAQLKAVEDEEVKRAVKLQKETGMQVVTDGEFRRAWWHFDFLEHLDGVEGFSPESGIQFHGVTTKAHAVKMTGKIDFTDHPMLGHYRYLHSVADGATAKMTIPSPNMLQFRGRNEYPLYEDHEALLHDLSAAYRKAIRAFYEAGCRYLQLDDTSWSIFFADNMPEPFRAKGFTMQQLQEYSVRSINEAIKDKPEDMVITMHICRGNFQSTWTASGGYDAASEAIFQGLNLDGLFLEFDDERSGSFEPLRYVNRKDLQVVLGLVTSKFGDLEDKDAVKRRIEEASRYVSLDQLCLSPQCGFASTEEGNLLTEEQQWEKLRHVAEIAEDVWK